MARLQPRWSLNVQLPNGASFTQLTNALRGNRSNSGNNTQVIELIAAYEDQILEPNAGSSVRFAAYVNATSQASATCFKHCSKAEGSSAHAHQLQDVQHPCSLTYCWRHRLAAGLSATVVQPKLCDQLSQPLFGMQAFTPQAVFLQGRQCDLTLTVNVTNETPVIPVDTSQLIESSPQPVSIDGINILGVDGEVLTLKGANWFGFETPVSFAGALQPGPQHTLCFDSCAVACQH